MSAVFFSSTMIIDTAVVPIAGLGTRLLPTTLLTAKEYLPLGNKPAIQHIVEELGCAGIKKIVFVVSENKQSVAKLFESSPEQLDRLIGNKSTIRERLWSCSPYANLVIETTVQEEQLGLGHAILCAKPYVADKPFVVALGDCAIGLPSQESILSRMMNECSNCQAEIAISFQTVPLEMTHKYGIAKPKTVGDCFELLDLIEKPKAESAPSDLAVCGRYILPPKIFQQLERSQKGLDNEIQLTDSIKSLIQSGAKSIGVRLPKGVKRYDVGDMKTYIQAFVEFALADSEYRAVVEQAVSEFRQAEN